MREPKGKGATVGPIAPLKRRPDELNTHVRYASRQPRLSSFPRDIGRSTAVGITAEPLPESSDI
jgi:hypothetical protein